MLHRPQIAVALALLSALLVVGSSRAVAETSLDGAMDAAMRGSGLPAAVAMAVTRSGEEISYASGPAIWGGEEPVSTRHIFRIASMTKLLTSIAALQLVERGAITLDEDLADLLPDMAAVPVLSNGELREGAEPVTLRHLLSHTSGFAYPGSTAPDGWLQKEDWRYADAPRQFESGSGFVYGTSTDWVGKLVEKVSGKTLEAYFKAHITGPLRMERTFFNVPRSLHPMIVSFGSRGADGREQLSVLPGRVPEAEVTEFSGGGGLFSTPGDYTKLLHCLLNEGAHPGGRILEAETVAALRENQVPEGAMDPTGRTFKPGFCCNFNGLMDTDSGWGLAFMLDMRPRDYGRSAGTGQWGGIFNTYFFIDFESGIAGSIFTQHLPFNHPTTTGLFETFSALAYGEFANSDAGNTP